MRASSLLLPALVLLAGCGFAFERSSEVIDRRVLGMQAEPPELVVDGSPLPPTVKVRALVVDPTDAAPVEYEWRVCLAAPRADDAEVSAEVASGLCDSKDPSTLLEKGTTALGEMEVDVPVPAEGLALLAAAANQGFSVSVHLQVQLRVWTKDGPVDALKRIVGSTPVPAGRTPNRNPVLTGLLLDGDPWESAGARVLVRGLCPPGQQDEAVDPATPGQVTRTCGHKVTPVFDENEAEPYEVQTFPDAGGSSQVLQLRERLRFAWFVDAGSLSSPVTEQPELFGPVQRDPLTTTWREPANKPSVVTLWVVVRDGRGGESWTSRTIRWAGSP